MISRSRDQLFISLLLIVLVDQISKKLATDIVINTGVSFGLFPSSWLTFGLSAAIILIAVKFGRQFARISAIVTGIFFGGSISNVMDRFVYGGVRDFLPVPLLDIRNNLADWAIALALIWLLYHLQKPATPNTV